MAVQGTVVVVLRDGTVRVDDPERPLSAWERREQPAAIFVRMMALPPEWEIRSRIEMGLRKQRAI